MIGCENVSVRADNYTRTEALQRLFALGLRTAAAKKLAQRIIGKRKPSLSARDRLGRKHCHNARRDLFHNRSEGCDNSLARLLRLLGYRPEHTRMYAKHCNCEQCTRSQDSPLHDGFTCKRESNAQSPAALFLIWRADRNLGL